MAVQHCGCHSSIQLSNVHSSSRMWLHPNVRSCPVHLAALTVRPQRKSKLARSVRPTHRQRRRVAARPEACQQTERDREPQALELVRSFSQQLQILEGEQLSSACKLLMYRLTGLCIGGHRAAVRDALLEDHNSDQENGFLVALPGFLGYEQDESCQSLAADLLVALLHDLPQTSMSTEDSLSHSWRAFATPIAASVTDDLLELVASSSAIKVKAAAVLVLLLAAMSDQSTGAQLIEDGAATVVFAQMVHSALSWSSSLGSIADVGELEQAMSAEGGASNSSHPPVVQDMFASLPLMAASRALLQQLLDQASTFSTKRKIILMWTCFSAFSAISQCKWAPAAAAPAVAEPSGNIINRAANWLRKQTDFDTTTEKWRFVKLCAACATVTIKPAAGRFDSMASLLALSQESERSLKQGEAYVARTQGRASEFAFDQLVGCLEECPSSLERHTMARSLVPYMVDMLQHPSSETRGAAVSHLSHIAHYALPVVATALLQAPEDALSGLLRGLASEEPLEHRARYALLIGACAAEGDAPVMKKISDAGATPYLLTLLKQADTDDTRVSVLNCLNACANKSPEIAVSTAVHGGITQLLELLNSSLKQAQASETSPMTLGIFTAAFSTLRSILHVQGSAVDHQLVVELPALLLSSVQCPAYASYPGMLLAALDCLCQLSAQSKTGKQQVQQSLTPAGMTAIIDGVLSTLEDADPEDDLHLPDALVLLIMEAPAGRQVLTQPAMLARLGKLFTDGPSDSIQAFVLPICAALSMLTEDGSPAPTPWLLQPPVSAFSTADLEVAHQAALLAPFTRPPPQQPTQSHSTQDAQALLAAAADRVIQRTLPKVDTSGSREAQAEARAAAESDVQALLAAAVDRVARRRAAAKSSSEEVGTSGSDNRERASEGRRPEAGSPASEILDITRRSSSSSTSTSAAKSENGSQSRESELGSPASERNRPDSVSSSSRPSTNDSAATRQDRNGPVPVRLIGLSGKALHDALVQFAVTLMLEGDMPLTRGRAARWLSTLPPALSDSACRKLASSSGAVQASLKLIRHEKHWAARTDALAFCLQLHHRGMLPINVLLDEQIHTALPKVMAEAAEIEGAEGGPPRSLAGCLLFVLWQQQPHLVAEFASHKRVAALLKLTSDRMMPSHARMVCTALVHQVWTYTASLVSEPLLVQAIPELVRNCVAYEPSSVASDQYKMMKAQLQEESLALLCTMADFAFYRPAIRDAEPTEALADIIHAGCSQSDSYQKRQMAQLAINLTYKLLKGQRDGSDGLDARHNTRFYTAISMNDLVQPSIINMCRRGTTESRHGALAALQQILSGTAYHQMDAMYSAELQISLISHSLVPMLFEVLTAPDSTAEMRKMARGCTACLDGDHNEFAAKLGCHCLLAKLTAGSVFLYRQAADADRRSR